MAKSRDDGLGRRIRRKLQYSLFRQKWNIAITGHPAAAVAALEGAERQRRALDDLQWMTEQRSTFAADPFVVTVGDAGELMIFYEEYPWSDARGRISCVRYRDGQFGPPAITLETPHHLSYPYVFEHDGEPVILPEHSAASDVSLYRLDRDGRTHGKEMLISGLGLVDSTITFHEGKFWLFATHAGPCDNTELHIYHADAVNGVWSAHEGNPVKTDRSNARPAGQFITHRGALFRPAQDCGAHYGAGIVINQVRVLTESAFEETPISEIRPSPGSRYDYGLHTISSVGDHTVIDGARMESMVHPALDRLGRFVRR